MKPVRITVPSTTTPTQPTASSTDSEPPMPDPRVDVTGLPPAEQHDLVLARLALTEAAAKSATPGPWAWNELIPRGYGLTGDGFAVVLPSAEPDVFPSRADAAHIVAQHPNVVLAQTAGRRRILERHAPEQRRVWRDPAPTDPNDVLIIDARNVMPGTDNGTAHVCARCARGASHLGPALWPCPDYRDAANGLVTGWETPNAR